VRHSKKPQEIREAAQSLFLAQGMRDTSMDAVAAAARVTKQTLYRYYRSKDELFVDALGGLVAEQVAASIADVRPTGPVDRDEFAALLLTLSRHIVDRVLEPSYLALLRVILAEARQFPDLAGHFRQAVIARFTTDLRGLLDSAPVAPLLAEPATDTTVRLFVGPVLAYLLEALMLDPEAVRGRAHAELPALTELFVRAVTGPAATLRR